MIESDHDFLDENAERAVILLPGWRHPVTKRIHIRRDCRAVEFYAKKMQPILFRMDDPTVSKDDLCLYCFAGAPERER